MPIQKLTEEPYASIICYPRTSKAELEKRLKELQKLGVSALEFSGEKRILNVHVLGKGCVGIVTLACRHRAKVALKIRRVDADRSGMQLEAALLKKANEVNVGPKFLDESKDFLLMQFIDGQLLPQWLQKKRDKKRIRKVLHDILEQCWRLDKAGLDHGELSHAPKHLIVDTRDDVFIVDFETASVNRRPSNVTSICQFLFMSELDEILTYKVGAVDKKSIIATLRRYKKTGVRADFDKVLESCGL